MPDSSPEAKAIDSAFALERIRAARTINLLRLVASSLFFLVHLVMGFGFGHAVWRSLAISVVLYGSIGFVCHYIVRLVLQLINDVTSEQLLRAHLGRFLSPHVIEVVERLGARTLGNESREITVLFSDLRDFTALSESLDPPKLIAMLNEVHSRMEEVSFAHGGTLDKFIGDGMMAYFGAPVPQADHAESAVQCALAMQAALGKVNEGACSVGAASAQDGHRSSHRACRSRRDRLRSAPGVHRDRRHRQPRFQNRRAYQAAQGRHPDLGRNQGQTPHGAALRREAGGRSEGNTSPRSHLGAERRDQVRRRVTPGIRRRFRAFRASRSISESHERVVLATGWMFSFRRCSLCRAHPAAGREGISAQRQDD